MLKGILAFFTLFLALQVHAKHINTDLQKQLAAAHSSYLKGNYETRQEAMLSLSRLLESTDEKVRNEAVGPNALAVTYIRLGILAKENKNNQLAGKYFNQGIASYSAVNSQMTLEDLVEATYELDNFARLYSQ